MINEDKINISGIIRESIVDGPGIRFVLFCQGCPHNCPECQNPETHPFGTGKDVTVEKVIEEMEKNPLLAGITLSGGEPFCQPKPLVKLCKEVRKRSMNVVAFSGYTYEELLEKGKSGDGTQELLDQLDILIDGRFLIDEKDLSLIFRGSQNQRVIDMVSTREAGKVILAEEYI